MLATRTQAAELRCQASIHEDEANFWADREAELAGNVAYHLRKKDEATADVFETRRQKAADEWLHFCRLAEDCRRELYRIEADERRFRDLAFVVKAA